MQIFRHSSRIAAAGFLGLAWVVAGSAAAQVAPGAVPGIFRTFSPPNAQRDLAPASPGFVRGFREGRDAYRDGKFGVARKFWEGAAQGGDLFSSWQLANMYRLGRGVPVNHAKAFAYYAKVAAEYRVTPIVTPRTRITVDAIVRLADYFRTGIKKTNIRQDPVRAYRLYHMAATHFGHPRAQFMLGEMYLRGEVVKKSIGRAMRWYLLAARKRHAPAQAALGRLYQRGEGVRKDTARALMWYTLAKENMRRSGDLRIAESYEVLYEASDTKQRDKVKKLVSAWNGKFGRGPQ